MSHLVTAVKTQDGCGPCFAGSLNRDDGQCQRKGEDGAVCGAETGKDGFNGLELIHCGTY